MSEKMAIRTRADEILRVQAAIARLKEQHAGLDGDPVAHLFLEHAEEQLSAALTDERLARDAMAAAQAAMARAGRGAVLRAVLRDSARIAASRQLALPLRRLGVGRPSGEPVLCWEASFASPVRGTLMLSAPAAMAEHGPALERMAEEAAAAVVAELAGPEREAEVERARQVDDGATELPLVAALVLVFDGGWVELSLYLAGA